jgi:hypothetical protein
MVDQQPCQQHCANTCKRWHTAAAIAAASTAAQGELQRQHQQEQTICNAAAAASNAGK